VSVGPELAALQAKVEGAVVWAGVAPERRRSSPHVTLPRLNGAPAFAVDSFVLYLSHLSRSGALH